MLDINSQFTPLNLQRTENQRFTTRRNVARRRRPFGAADVANSQVQTLLPDQRLSAHLYRDRGASHGRACFSRALQDLRGVSRTADCWGRMVRGWKEFTTLFLPLYEDAKFESGCAAPIGANSLHRWLNLMGYILTWFLLWIVKSICQKTQYIHKISQILVYLRNL